ncbi:hypothetical protein GGR54DRAFT_252512 [Hypoxylon sp. NC1633]|nr:hypothetical protein GGR54DRAFT_252512 [Hypoxylon sp. NC1633]
MDRDLDALIESLLTEIAFSGVRGCSVTALLKAIESFYRDPQHELTDSTDEEDRDEILNSSDRNGAIGESQVQQSTVSCDLTIASKTWRWLVARTDVSVGLHRQFNHLSLDEILALPEEGDPLTPTSDIKVPNNRPTTTERDQTQSSQDRQQPRRLAQKYRPHLHVSEDRQWKTLTGHGPDLKRVPQFEWKALVDIASMREQGILQGDLVRLSGQDKRSLPTRTDALAKKGYIIKQPIILRGCRSSKLWLAQYAQHAKKNRDGLNFDKVDLSKDALTGDLAPVPFSSCWNGERLDYIAIAQAFHAVIKAWKVMRYCDMRAKLDIENRVPQMRALSKTSRWFTSIGAVTFVAAKFADSQKLFKDCVKFIRDPTPEEWNVFRTTPSAHIKAPSARLGKRGQASRARHKNEANTSSHSQTKPKTAPNKTDARQEVLTPSLWNRHKPIVNTTYEIVKRAGEAGSSNFEVNRRTLGYFYRKYTAALTSSMSLPSSQPPHLARFEVTSQLTRVKRTMTYQFFVKGDVESLPAADGADDGVDDRVQDDIIQDPEAGATAEAPDGESPQQVSIVPQSRYSFSQPVLESFAPASSSSLTQVNNTLHRPRQKGGRKRKIRSNSLPRIDASIHGPPRRSKKVRIEEPPAELAPIDEGVVGDQDSAMPGKEPEVVAVPSSQQPIVDPVAPPPRPPGVYRECDNMLDPPGKKGRRRRSIVVTIRLDALKDPSWLERMRNRRPTGPAPTSSHQTESIPAADSAPGTAQNMTADDSTNAVMSGTTQTTQKPGNRRTKASYKCDKCGNTWKNSNGLEYHLNKSQTPCNPSYVPAPPPPPKPSKQTPMPRVKSSRISKNQTLSPSHLSGAPRKSSKHTIDGADRPRLPPSKRIRLSEAPVHSQDTDESPRPGSIRGSIILQDVEAYDVVDHRRRRRNARQVASPSFHGPASQASRARREFSQVGGPITAPVSPATNLPTPPPRSTTGVDHSVSELALHSTAVNHPVLNTAETRGGTEAENSQARTSDSVQPGQESTSKQSRKSSKVFSVGTLRRERASLIIQQLLDENDFVFPGQRSVYLAMVSAWSKKYSDIEPPDCKVVQNVMNRMEKAGLLVQLHFVFVDGHGQLQECCVLAKPQPGMSDYTVLAGSPKVISVKDKMREMFPEPYIPEKFSLPQEDSELFGAVSSQHKDAPKPNETPKTSRISAVTDNIEVLQYSELATGSKRHMEEGESTEAPPAKKPCYDSRNIDQPRKPPRPRRRIENREYWDTGKVAKYIWNQKKHPGQKWDQKPARLQDFTTGAWSVSPQESASSQPDCVTVLSSLRILRKTLLGPMRSRYNDKSKDLGEASEENDADLSQADDIEEVHGGGTLDTTANRSRGFIVDRFDRPSFSTSFLPEDTGSEELNSTVAIPPRLSTSDDDPNTRPDGAGISFVRSETIQCLQLGTWPWLPFSYFESDSSFAMAGAMPDPKWFQRENLPQNAQEVISTTSRGRLSFNSWTDPVYGKFLTEVDIIEKWEQSPEGSQILTLGSVAPDFIFMSLSPDITIEGWKPVTLEWTSVNQFSLENLPNEIKNASADDDNIGIPIVVIRRGRPRTRPYPEPSSGSPRPKTSPKKPANDAQVITLPDTETQYKTRMLKPIHVQKRGRLNKLHPNESVPSSETELIVAYVVVRTLLGGVDGKVDLGLILTIYPKLSVSGLRKFWPKVSKERKTYIDTLTKKFQLAFLEEYEAGNIDPLNYDDLDSYDWHKLIHWATKLETHENVDLPDSRDDLDEAYSLEGIANEPPDWREAWFQPAASMFARIEGTSSEAISTPLGSNVSADEEMVNSARSWVRSLCVTQIRGAGMPGQVRAKLLALSGGNEDEANNLLKGVVDRLTLERVAAKSKGKIFGQALRLHGVFAKQLAKSAAVEKVAQAVEFKGLLDETFRKGEGFVLPYAANDGIIMAVINLQAHGRIRMEPIDPPNIPFGFEPGNYDGRTFPKTYYHFEMKLWPTESYMFDKDLSILNHARGLVPPREGPRGEIPIWVDFFGRLDKRRWVTYLSMVTLALATKGPLTAQSTSVLLRPHVEPFEAKIIMDWVDSMGLLDRFESEQSATVNEWWWLVAGTLVMDVLRTAAPRTWGGASVA